MISLTQRCWIRAIHTLDSERDPQNNLLVHGHHCAVDVSFWGEPNEESGLLVSRDQVKEILRERVVRIYDNKNLNNLMNIPSGENLVKHIFESLKSSSLGDQVYKVVLHETAKNQFTQEQVQPA